MKELEDYTWFPKILRNYQTDYIGFVVANFKFYQAYIDLLKQEEKRSLMIDLCSGSGQPAIDIFMQCQRFESLVLTDKYPNVLSLKSQVIQYDDNSKDVLEMAFNSDAYYTMFNAFHHFEDVEKVRIVKKLVDSGARASIVEILNPSLLSMLKVLFATLIGSLLFMPFVKPFSWKRLLLTYVIPINVFTITYDGVVSVLKSRSLSFYKQLFAEFDEKVEVLQLKTLFNKLIVIQIKETK